MNIKVLLQTLNGFKQHKRIVKTCLHYINSAIYSTLTFKNGHWVLRTFPINILFSFTSDANFSIASSGQTSGLERTYKTPLNSRIILKSRQIIRSS